MKFAINKQDLSQLVSKIQSIIPLKPSIPILSNVLVEAKGDELILTATDLMIGVRCFCNARVLEEGAVAIPARHLTGLVRELPEVPVEVEILAGGMVEIKAADSLFKLRSVPKEGFPQLPDCKTATCVRVRDRALKEALYRTSFAAAKEDTRYALTGVYMQIAGGTASFVATDGKKLAKIQVEMTTDPGFQGSFILPNKVVEELQRELKDTDLISLHLMNDRTAVETKSSFIVSKLLEGDYPDFGRLIPKAVVTTVVLHREELIFLLRQVILFTSESNSSARFLFANQELTITANSLDMGEGKASMPIDYDQEPLQIALNPQYFLEILKHSKDETIRIGLSDPYTPALITDSTDALFVIMPMRLVEQT